MNPPKLKSKSLTSDSSTSKLSFAEQFKAMKAQTIERATTKRVNFKMIVGCGCGDEYMAFNAEVPIDNPIKDGDYVTEFSDWMSDIQTGWYDDPFA